MPHATSEWAGHRDERSMPRTDLAVALALAAFTVLSRVPLRSRLLPTWDAVQFALALRKYDIVSHQPHPPGYILYVAAARAVEVLVGDATQSFVWLAIAASGATVFFVYRLAWMLYGRLPAVVAAVGLAASPLFWFYGEVGLPYAVEAALASAIAMLTWPMRWGRTSFVLWSALAVGVAGGVRQSLLALLLPLWVWTAWTGMRRWTPLIAGGVVMAVTSVLWFVPMVWLAGGPGRYFDASRELFDSTVRPTTVMGPPGAWLGNVRAMIEALVLGMGLLLPVMIWILARRVPRGWETREWFVAAWILPPLGVYTWVHFGQYGYLLTVLPALYVLIAPGLATAISSPAGSRRRRWATSAALAGVVLAHAAFLVTAAPIRVHEIAGDSSWAERQLAALRALYRHRLWAHTVRGLREQEGVVAAYTEAIRRDFDPADTVIVVELGNPRSYPWFRHVTYYLPEFRACHLRLPPWSPGYLDSAHLTSMATRVDDRIVLEPRVQHLVWMVDHWDRAVPRPPGLREVPLPYGRWLYVLDLHGRPVEHAGYRFSSLVSPPGH